jgi:quercetin dioxygenase-like cupin family protein
MADQSVPASELGAIRPFDRVEWVDEAAFGRADPAMVAAAQALGARRKFLARGEEGLYVQWSTMPAGYRVAPHSHTEGEVLFVLRGGCTIEPTGAQLGPSDSAVIPAGQEYGFTCGPSGMDFLAIRAGDARSSFVEPPVS